MRVLIIDANVGHTAPLLAACKAEGWTTQVVAEPPEGPASAAADALILLVQAGNLSLALPAALKLARACAAPILLATNMDRSGWDRTFSSPAALEVDALFDLPVEAEAMIRRLKGILDARAQELPSAPPADAGPILDRAIAGEEAAAAFYAQAAKSAKRKDTREALEGLARDEQEHKRLLLKFKEGRAPLPAVAPQRSGLLETFDAPEFTPDMAPADAFLLAARKEMLSIDFYENWAALCPAGPERDLLKQLADVERRHKAAVEAMFTNAAFPERW